MRELLEAVFGANAANSRFVRFSATETDCGERLVCNPLGSGQLNDRNVGTRCFAKFLFPRKFGNPTQPSRRANAKYHCNLIVFPEPTGLLCVLKR